MLRALGVPARYVTGFSSTAVANQEIVVKAKEAHAWVEVYVDGLGWVNIDPTGGGGGGGGTPPPEEEKDPIYNITIKSGSATAVYYDPVYMHDKKPEN